MRPERYNLLVLKVFFVGKVSESGPTHCVACAKKKVGVKLKSHVINEMVVL